LGLLTYHLRLRCLTLNLNSQVMQDPTLPSQKSPAANEVWHIHCIAGGCLGALWARMRAASRSGRGLALRVSGRRPWQSPQGAKSRPG